jgi:hypothetical protein
MRVRFHIRRWLPGLLLLAAAAPPAWGQQVRAYVSEDSVRVGDRFLLSLVAEHDPTAEPVFPSVADSLRFGDVEVLAEQSRARVDRGGARIDSVVYVVTTFALDSAAVPPIRLRFTADADTFSAASDSLHIPVTALVPPQAPGIRDLAPLIDFPAPVWPWVLLVAGVLAVVGLLAYAIWKKRQARPPAAEPAPPPRVLTPYEEALERLGLLETADVGSAEAVKPYYVALSDVLRHYLARRTGVNAMECTTRELVRELERRTPLPAEAVRRTRLVLELADFVKFADAHPAAERSRAALGEAREALDRVEGTLRAKEEQQAQAREPEGAAVRAS